MTGGAEAARRYDELIADIRHEFPRFRIVAKRAAASQRAIHWTLVALTLGRMRAYMTRYQTTIGRTVYVTDDWDRRDPGERYITMRHERVHLRQFRRYSLLGMTVLYVLLPLPMGLAWCRAYLEKQAYAETIAAAIELHGPAHVRNAEFRDGIVAQFCGAAYGWMWPFPRQLNRWYDAVVSELVAGTPSSPRGVE